MFSRSDKKGTHPGRVSVPLRKVLNHSFSIVGSGRDRHICHRPKWDAKEKINVRGSDGCAR